MGDDNVAKFPDRPRPASGNETNVSPPPLGFGTEEGGLASMDVEAFMNMRDWLQRALEAQGAKVWGAGIGCGQADVSIDLGGFGYNVSIRPSPTYKPRADT